METSLSLLQFVARRRLPVILQTEVSECGLACLAMVATSYGHQIDLNTLRRNYPVSLKGATLKGLMITADKLRMGCRALRLEPEEISQLRAPAILHWDMNHFVVLKKAHKQHIVIHDPAQGEREVPMTEVRKHFTGVALEVMPVQGFEAKKEKSRMRISDFWQRIQGLKRGLSQLLVLSIVLQCIALASPFYMQLVVDEVIVSHDIDLLHVLAIGFLFLALIDVSTQVLRSYVVLHLGNMLSFQMAVNIFRHLIRLPLEYFEKRHIGDIVSRFSSMHEIKELLTTGLVAVIVDGIMSIATLLLMYFYSPILGGVVTVAVLLYALLRAILYRPLKLRTEETIVAGAKENTHFMESVRAIQSIKLFGRESDRQNLWQNRYADVINAGIRLGKLNIGYTALNGLLFGIENVLVVYLGAKAVLDSSLSIGMLFAFMAYKRQFTQSTIALIEKTIEFRMLNLHIERLADIALTPKEKTSGDIVSTQKSCKGDMQLRNISFRYSADEPFILKNVDLIINSGESVAIVGPSGCGKTSLMKLMLGLLPTTEGEILLDNTDINKVGLSNYRQKIAAVMQDDQLLSGSIADNISFFDQEQDQEKIERCAHLAAIDKDILAMPMTYNTLIGDMGTTLSGGQRQRVLLARALYREPTILLLDEATSHLDTGLESKVNDAIKSLQITRIIIAHRPETIRSADRVVRLENHTLVESTDLP